MGQCTPILTSKAFSKWGSQFPSGNNWHQYYYMYYNYLDLHHLLIAASYGFTYYFNNYEIQGDINATDELGRTALSWATINGNRPILKILLQRHDIDANIKNRRGLTPLHYAIINDHGSTAELLITTGVDVETKDRLGRTPLCLAVERQNTSVIRILVTRKANLNVTYRVSKPYRYCKYGRSIDG